MIEPLEPRLLLAADTILDGAPGADFSGYANNPYFTTGMAAEFDDFFADIFTALEEIEGVFDIQNELLIDLPGLLDREEAGGAVDENGDGIVDNDHHAVSADDLLNIAAQLGESGTTDVLNSDGDVTGGTSFTDVLRSAFGTDIANIVASGANIQNAIAALGDLTDQLSTADQADTFYGASDAVTYQLDVDTSGFSFSDLGGGNWLLSFDFGLAMSRVDMFSLDLGRNADLLGFTYGADDPGKAGLPDVTLSTFFRFDSSINLTLALTAVDAAEPTDDGMGGTNPTDGVVDDLTVTFNENTGLLLDDGAVLTGIAAGSDTNGDGVADDAATLANFDMRIGFLEIVTEADFLLNANLNYDLANTTAGTLDSFTPVGANVDEAGDLTALLTITADVTNVGNLAGIFSVFDGVEATLTLTADPFLESFGSEGGPDPRTAPAIGVDADFGTYFEPFVNVSSSSIISLLGQVRSFLFQFQNSTDLFGVALPFADEFSLLGSATDLQEEILDWAGSLTGLLGPLPVFNGGNFVDTALFDVNEATSEITPLFDSIQGLLGITQFTDVLGTLLPSFDTTNKVLTFGFSLDNQVTPVASDFNFDMNLGNLVALDASGSLSFDSALGLSFLLGIDLGGAAEVAIVASEAALAITSLYNSAGTNLVNANLSSAAKFRLKVNGFPGVDVELAAGNYTDVAGLAAALQMAIDDEIDSVIDAAIADPNLDLFEAERPTILVGTQGGRLTIGTPDGTFLTITPLEFSGGGFGDFDNLGLIDGTVTATPIEARASVLPANGVLSGDATFDVSIDGDTFQTVTVNANNAGVDALLDEIEQEINTIAGPNVVTVVRAPDGNGGYRIVLADANASIRIDNVNAVAARELGLKNDSVAADIALVGDREIDFDVPGAKVLPANGQISSYFDIAITIDGTSYGPVTVFAESTDGTVGPANEDRGDLLEDIRAALQRVEVRPGVTLAEMIELGVDGAGRLTVTSFFEPADAITIAIIGTNPLSTGDITGTLAQGVGVDGLFETPATGTNISSVSFDVEVTATDGTKTTTTVTVNEAGSLSAVVDNFNAALPSNIAAGLNDGRLVFAALDDDIRSIRVTGIGAGESNVLGLANGASAVAAPASGAFIADAAFSATLTGTATGSASADLGFLGIEIGDISGSLTGEKFVSASVTGELVGGTLFGVADAISLDRLFDAVSGKSEGGSKIIDLIGANIVVTGEAGIELGDISVSGAGGVLDDIQAALDAAGVTETITLAVGDITTFDPAELIAPNLDLGFVGDFLSFDFGDIQGAFQKALDFLDELTELDFLDTPLPFVGLNLSEALGFIDGFKDVVDDILSRDVATVQDLTDAMMAALELIGISDSVLTDALDILDITYDENSPGVLGFDIGFDRVFGGVLPINFSLTDLGIPAEFAQFANLSGSANLAAEFGARVGLSFGVQLDDPLNGLFINNDKTGIEITGFAQADEVSFIASLGPLAALVDGGAILLGGIGPDNTIFSFSLADLVGDTLDLDSLISQGASAFTALLDDIEETFGDIGSIGDVFNFGFDTVLPIFAQFGGQSIFIGNLSFEALVDSFDDLEFFLEGVLPAGGIDDILQNLQLPSFDILTTLFGGDFLDNLGLLDTIQLFVEGVDLAFGTLGDLFTGELLGLDGVGDIPLIGDALESAGEFFDDIRNELITPLAQLIDQTPEFLANIFGQILGLIQDTIGDFIDGVGSFAIEFLDGSNNTLGTLTTAFLDALNNPTGFLDGNAGDAINSFEELIEQAHGFEILFQLGDSYQVDVPDVDFGIPAFGLEVDDPLAVAFKWGLVFGLGINKDEGFYLALDPNGGEEINLELALNLPSGIALTLGFLKATATNLGGNSGAADLFANPELNDLYGFFNFDIIDEGDGKLGFADLPNTQFDVGYGAGVDVDLELELGFGGVIPAGVASGFPSLVAQIGFDWGFGETTTTAAVWDSGDPAFTLPELPELRFDKLGLQLGSFLTDVLSPVVDFVQTYIDPILPLLNLLIDPIPVISDLNGEVSLLDIAAEFGLVNDGLVTAIEIIVGIANSLNDLDISGGDFVVWIVDNTGGVAGALDGFTLGGSGFDLTNPSNGSLLKDPTRAIADVLGDIVGDGLQDILNFLGDGSFSGLLDGAIGGAASQTGNNSFNLLNGGGGAGGAGLVFPFLDDPGQIFGLLFGRDATLIGLDIPPLVFGFEYKQFFSIWGPIGVELGGAFSATFDFDVAYDTAGVRRFIAGDLNNPLDLFEGFYFLDDSFENPGVDTPEITLYGEITAALAISIGVASAGVGGGIYGTFNVDWHDPNGDLKVRFSEIAANVTQNDNNILCIFDYSVLLEAKLFVFVEALFGLWRKEWNFGPSLPLVDLTLECEPDPLLATEDGDVLRLNMGEFSKDRKFEGGDNVSLEDVDEDFYVFEQGGEIWVEAVIDGKTVSAQNYGPTSKYNLVLGRAGLENDKIFMDGTRISGSSGAVDVAGDLSGGDGDDELQGGDGDDLILGDAGGDKLRGGGGNDTVRGGTGDDCIEGQGGNDTLFGEIGSDVIQGGAGDDTLDGAEGDDVLLGDAGNDLVWGRVGNDSLSGGADSDILSGGLGADQIWGDIGFTIVDCAWDGSSFAVSGIDGADFIAGGAGSDRISADGGDDFVWGDSDFATEDDGITVAADVSISIIDDGEGATGATVLASTMAPPTVIAGLNSGAADIISGGADDDVLFGEEGNDIVRGDLFDAAGAPLGRFNAGLTTDAAGRSVGTQGNDIMDGFRGADVMFGSGGNDWGFGGVGTDFLIGNAGNDNLRGATGRDVLFGDDASIDIFESGDTDRYIAAGGPASYSALTFDPYELATANPGTGGNDNLLGGVDDDIVFGGNGNDTIDGQGGRELIFGDHGTAEFTYDTRVGISIMTLVYTSDPGQGGSDSIEGGLGEDIILGGAAGDMIDGDVDTGGPQSDDVILSDFGEITQLITLRLLTGFVAEISTVAGALGGTGGTPAAGDYGNDTVTGGGGADVIFGGLGSDILVGGANGVGEGETRDIVVGDDGRLSYVESGTITTVDGNNLTGDNDQAPILDSDPANDPLGLTLDLVETDVSVAAGDADTISGGAGDDIILAGGGGDIVRGDDEFNVNTASFVTTSELASGIDIVIGDQGVVALTNALIRVVRSTATDNSEGGGDSVSGNFGDDVVIGGVSDGATDTLGGDAGDDILLGDEGVVLFTWDTTLNVRDRIFTTSFALGAADIIRGNAGDDVGIGGSGSDDIQGDNAGGTVEAEYGDDLLIGDQGELDYVTVADLAELRVIFSTDTLAGDGAIDTIRGDAGDDILIGGVAGDFLYGESSVLGEIANTSYDDVILGDEGRVFFLVAANELVGPKGAVPVDSDPDTIDVVETTIFELGDGDTISGGRGFDIAMGGAGADLILGDNLPGAVPATSLEPQFGDDLLIGDQGQVVNLLGILETVDTTDTVETDGAGDTIEGNGGDDIVLGGVGTDVLSGEADIKALANATGNFDDLLLGDEGRVEFDPDAGYRVLVQITTTDTNLGAGDFIFGNRGNDVALGGTGGDVIHGDVYRASGALATIGVIEELDDILIGDHGRLDYDAGELDKFTTIDTAEGGSDTITGDDDDDIILGGAFGDRLYGEHSAAGLAAGLIDSGAAGDDIVLGDNGRLDWGLATTVTGASGEDGVLDASHATLDRVWVIAPNHGGDDVIFGNGADDLLVGGTGTDLMWGDSGDGLVPNDGAPIQLGNEGGQDGPDGADVMFGDHAVIYPTLAREAAVDTDVTFNDFFLAIFTAAGDGGAADLMFGNGEDDQMLGQQGDDLMFGGAGDDDMAGGHNVQGGIDELDALATEDYDLGPALADMTPIDPDDLNDVMDGGEGDDEVAGDNAAMYRIAENVSPRFRQVGTGGQMYTIKTEDFAGIADDGLVISIDESIAANVGANFEQSPDHDFGRHITILDHDKTIQDAAEATPGDPHVFGNDVLVGGLNDDEMWGGLGDDIMQGDGLMKLLAALGTTTFDPTQGADPSFDLSGEFVALATDEVTGYFLSFRVVESAGDGDDYMEGGGGNDRMYGNLGSDDMIGGSSNLYGLDDGLGSVGDPFRPDGADLMYGSVGLADRLARNADEPNDGGFDSDVMMGDNGSIYRLTNGDGAYEEFNYDQSVSEKVIPRPVDTLDYGYEVHYDGSDPNNPLFSMTNLLTVDGIGAGDLMYGEAGDDFMFGQTGDDVMFGNAQNDAMQGGRGNDILLGGAGEDGILGDDGLLRMSRVPTDGGSQGNTPILSHYFEPLWGIDEMIDVNQEISTPGNLQRAIINVEDELRYQVDLLAFRTSTEGSQGGDQEFNDLLFGGLGADWMHGGEGDDGISGAEALPFYYSGDGADFGSVNAALQSQQTGSGLVDGAAYPVRENPFWFEIALYNPGDLLRHNGKSVASEGGNASFTNVEAEFAAYDSFNPRDRVWIDPETGLSVPIADLTGGEIEFILNFDASDPDAPADESFPVNGVDLRTDGNDRIFGDLGNDWIVGGTARDNMYGGRGNDLLNMDDEHDTNDGLNDDPDAFQAYADIAYGGAGRDVLILNTGADRAIDWVGEFNSYLVPFSPFGAFHISRSLQPQLAEFLLELSESDGADRTGPDLAKYLLDKARDARTDNPDPARHFEPFSELGMVRQQDLDWGEQTGAPTDPQAGNLQGKREIMRRALFADEPLQGNPNNGNVQGFAPDSGDWFVKNGVYNVAPTLLGDEAVSIYFLPDQQPIYMEILATINLDKDKAGWKSNGYLIFDYQDETTFKFAGINAMTKKVEIGIHDAAGWHVLTDGNMLLRDGTNYNVTLVMHGTVASVYVNGGNMVTHTFADPLNDGYVGLGTDGAKSRFDNWQVQKLPPVITFEFAGRESLELASGSWSDDTGVLSGATPGDFAIATRFVDVAIYSMLEVEAKLEGDGLSGIIFDYLGAENYKFAGIDAVSGQVVIGHVTSKGVVIDATAAVAIGGAEKTLKVTMLGGGVSVELNGKAVLGHVYASILNDGMVGVFADTAGATINSFAVRGDDPAHAQPLMVAAPPQPGEAATGDQLTTEAIDTLTAEALDRWAAELGVDAEEIAARLDEVVVVDLQGNMAAMRVGGVIYVDADAAGHGWFIDETPDDDSEFAGEAPDGIDLLSVLMHEIGHALDFGHGGDQGDVMDPTISEGERFSFEDGSNGFVVENATLDDHDDHSVVWATALDPGDRKGRPDYVYDVPRRHSEHSRDAVGIAAE